MRPGVRGLLGISIALGLGAIGVSSVISARRFAAQSASPTARPPPSARKIEAPPSASVTDRAPPALPPLLDVIPESLSEQREVMFTNMKNQLGLGDPALSAVRAIFEHSR